MRTIFITEKNDEEFIGVQYGTMSIKFFKLSIGQIIAADKNGFQKVYKRIKNGAKYFEDNHVFYFFCDDFDCDNDLLYNEIEENQWITSNAMKETD